MNTALNDTRALFNADLIRSKGTNLSQHLEALAPLADLFAEQVAVELVALSQLPIKVSLVEARSTKLVPLAQIEAGFDLVLSEQTVSCWSNADADFIDLMCEICLGGNGGNKTEQDAERPATPFDRKLRALIAEKIATAAGKALGEISEHVDVRVQQRPRMAARKVEGVRVCYSIRLLINVFDQACEYEFFMSFSECLKLVGGGVSSEMSATRSAASLVERTPFCIEVFLKPDVLDIRQILNLVPGEVLKLNVSATTPVELKLNGTDLSRGILSYSRTGGHVRLLGDPMPMTAAVTGLSHGN
jgi:flagellar motor switch protein FliM